MLQNLQENTCARISFLIKLQVLFCEFCKIFKKTFFYRTLPVAAFDAQFSFFIARHKSNINLNLMLPSYRANQLTGFYMKVALPFNWLTLLKTFAFHVHYLILWTHNQS